MTKFEKNHFLDYKREGKNLKGETRVLFLRRRGRLESNFYHLWLMVKQNRIPVTFICLAGGKSPDFVHLGCFSRHFYSSSALGEMGRRSALLSCLRLIGQIDTDLNKYMVYVVLNL